MIPLAEQRAFIRGELSKLGAALQFDHLDRYADELETNASLKTEIESKIADVDFFRTKHWDSILRFGLYRFAQYAMARAVKAAGVIVRYGGAAGSPDGAGSTCRI